MAIKGINIHKGGCNVGVFSKSESCDDVVQLAKWELFITAKAAFIKQHIGGCIKINTATKTIDGYPDLSIETIYRGFLVKHKSENINPKLLSHLLYLKSDYLATAQEYAQEMEDSSGADEYNAKAAAIDDVIAFVIKMDNE